MSYHAWTIDGYGMCTDKIQYNTTIPKVKELIKLAPKYENQVADIIGEFKNDDKASEFINALAEESYYGGLASIMVDIIEETENIHLISCSNFDNECFLLFEPCYPWTNKTKEEKEIDTPEKVEKLFQKYFSLLSDEPIILDYESVENGG